jgi:hypothetical protein
VGAVLLQVMVEILRGDKKEKVLFWNLETSQTWYKKRHHSVAAPCTNWLKHLQELSCLSGATKQILCNPNSFSEGTSVQIELFQLDKFPTMEYNYTLFPHP